MYIEHDPAGQRFVAHLAEGKAVLAYQPLEGGVLDIYSVHVPTAARDRGIAALLVAEATAYARNGGYRVIPSCSYVAAWFRSHPDEADLRLSPP